MEKVLEKLFEKVLLRPVSILIVWAIFLLVSINCLPEDIHLITWKHWAIISAYFSIAAAYTVACIIRNKLPKGKNRNSSILFIIDAENHQLFQEVKTKLVSEFEDYSQKGFGTCFEAICVEKKRVNKYNITKSESAIELLEVTNCVFLYNVRYSVDSVTNSDNFRIQTDYGIIHPAIEEKARKDFLQTDIRLFPKFCVNALLA